MPALAAASVEPMQLSLSHLGYLPDSPKTFSLLPGDSRGLPDTIPFYIRQNCLRMARDVQADRRFLWPISFSL